MHGPFSQLQVANKFKKYPEESVLQDDTLQMLALTNPIGMFG